MQSGQNGLESALVTGFERLFDCHCGPPPEPKVEGSNPPGHTPLGDVDLPTPFPGGVGLLMELDVTRPGGHDRAEGAAWKRRFQNRLGGKLCETVLNDHEDRPGLPESWFLLAMLRSTVRFVQ